MGWTFRLTNNSSSFHCPYCKGFNSKTLLISCLKSINILTSNIHNVANIQSGWYSKQELLLKKQKLLCESYKHYYHQETSSSSEASENLSQEKFRLMVKRCRVSYVMNLALAEKIVSCIMTNRANSKAPVLEINCGPGLVSREFLKQGASKVVALETNHVFKSYIKKIQAEIGDQRYHHFSWPMLSFFLKLNDSPKSTAVADYKKYEQTVAELLKEKHCDIPYSIFSVGGKEDNSNFIFFIIRNLPNDDIIISKGFVEFFFLAHPRFQKKIINLASFSDMNSKEFQEDIKGTRNCHFNPIHAIIYLLYDISFIGEFDASSFVPPFNSTKKPQDKDIDTTKRVLVKLQLKKNINEVLPPEQHVPFLLFLRQLYKKKKSRTIPTMEMLIPGCGLRMLYEGFTMMDIIQNTKLEHFLHLFKAMLDWPEYETSTLRQHISMKSTGGADLKKLEEELDHLESS
ncbi:hypothetical protein Btru_056732 [Bulinus truncatus]|nr:hypothetical protein Btru_056732 [Bulinus truncatus]